MLTHTQIRNATKPGKLTDGKGLYIEVRATGTKLWRYRYKMQVNGQAVEYLYAVGEYAKAADPEAPAIAAQRRAAGQFTLDEARTERLRLRTLVKQGIHPKDDRDERKAVHRDQRANTFEAVAREWAAKQIKNGKWKDHTRVIRFLEADVFPEIGKKLIRAVSAANLLAIMERVEARAPNVAFLLRQYCGCIFRYAMSKLIVEGDPTTALRGAIDKPDPEHHKPLSPAQIPALTNKLAQSDTVLALGVGLLLLTFVRPTELRAAEWAEFDLTMGEWRIPADRMKGNIEHRVPLSRQAVTLLRKLEQITGKHKHLFPNARRPDTYMSENAFQRILYSFGYKDKKFTPHGFRSTASTQLNEMNYRADVIEAQLAHKEADQTRGSYNRALYMPERKQMMQDWADHIDALSSGNITPIRQHKAA